MENMSKLIGRTVEVTVDVSPLYQERITVRIVNGLVEDAETRNGIYIVEHTPSDKDYKVYGIVSGNHDRFVADVDAGDDRKAFFGMLPLCGWNLSPAVPDIPAGAKTLRKIADMLEAEHTILTESVPAQ